MEYVTTTSSTLLRFMKSFHARARVCVLSLVQAFVQ